MLKVKSLLFAVLKGEGFTTKLTVAFAGLLILILNESVPAFSFTFTNVLSKEIVVPAVVKVVEVVAVTALSLYVFYQNLVSEPYNKPDSELNRWLELQ